MMEEVLLTSVSNEFEAGMIESLLAAENIPVLKKQRGAGQYLEIYMAMSTYGVDLYVPADSLGEARALIGEGESEQPAPDEELIQAGEALKKGRRTRSWIILLLVFPGLLWLLVYNLGNLIRILR
ncbi:MAG: DUF2007 domain-containing protein [Bacillota bacterium]|nr:DUF2007 domain-containing protein [Bacillota bacterium]